MKKIEALFSSILLIAGVAAQAKTVISYPTIPSKPYTGEVQSPDVPTSLDYELVNAQSGTSVGDYPVYLSLTDPTNTKWPDTDEEIGSTTWSITKAGNEWTTEPSIESWTYGDPTSTPVATAKFGTPTVTFSGTAKDGTTYTDVSSVAKAGTYTCKFTVAGTFNYEGLDPVVKNFEIKVATPGGGGGGGSGNVDISVTGYDGPYDGNDHQISVVITGDDALTFTVTYSDAQEGPFKSENTYKYKEIGTYTVWYCLQSVNYATVTNSAVVKISQREITPPTIASKEYNGAMQKADVTETADYTVEYNGEFKEAGTHEDAVVLALKDKTHCKWADGAEDPVLLSFTITKSASNVWLTEPSITGWQYGEAAHIPVAVPKYGVVSVLYDGTTTDGTEIKDATAVSKAGSYTAKFTVPETTSYNGLSKNVAFSIERGKIDIGGGGGSGGAKIEVTNYTGTYDGDEHTAAIAVTGDASSSFALTYSLTEAGAYTAEKPSFSNACETTKIWYSVSSPDYQTITNYATVAIAKRPVTLESQPKSWTYDGDWHSNAVATCTSENTFVAGETVTTNFTARIRDAGDIPNAFDIAWNGTALSSNYALTLVTNNLTVTQAANEWTTTPAIEGWTYGETAKTPVGAAKFGTVAFAYDPTPVGDAGNYTMTASVAGTANYTALSTDVSFTIAKKTIPGGGDEPGGGEVPPGGLSKYDVTVMYDGAEHTIVTNKIAEAFKTVIIGAFELQYAVGNGTAWGSELPAWKDVVATSLWYKVTSPNYNDFLHQAKVTVTNRPVTVTSGTKLDFVYDGKPHAYTNLAVTAGSFVAGEGIATSNWATVTTVAEGQVDNAFGYAPLEGTKLENYDFAVVTGKIAIAQAGAVTVTVTGRVNSVTYDGTEKSVSGYDVVSISDPLYKATDFKFTGVVATNGTDAGTYPMGLKPSDFVNTNGNFSSVTFNVTDGSLVIAQAANEWTTTPAIESWTYGETAKTPVGAAKFGAVAFTYDPTPVGDAGNYTMTASVAGTANYTGLSKDVAFIIAKKTIPGGGDEPGGGEVPPGGLSKYDVTAMYDGGEHTIDTNKIAEAFRTVVVGAFEMQYAVGNGTAWGSELPAWKDVVATSLWYKVMSPNYEDYTHQAKVTITPRDIANATMAPIAAVEYTGVPVTPVPTVTDGTPSIITTSDYTVSYANNNAPGTATLTLTGKGNYTGTKSANFTITSPTPKYATLTGSIAWKLNLGSGCYTAQLKLSCTNGFESGISNLRYLFADRMNGSKTTASLWDSSSRAVRPAVSWRDVTYRSVSLDASKITRPGASVVYGVKDVSQFKSVISSDECTIELYVPSLAVPSSYEGLVVWTSGGSDHALKISASGGATPVPESVSAAAPAQPILTTVAPVALPTATTDELGLRNVFTSKDKTDKVIANAVLAIWKGTYVMAYPEIDEDGVTNGWNTFSIKIGTRGRTIVAGILASGKSVSASAQMLVGDEWCKIAVSSTRKNATFAFTLWPSRDGEVLEVEGVEGAVIDEVGNLTGESAFKMSADDLAIVLGTDAEIALGDVLPEDVPITLKGYRWVLPTAGSVRVVKKKLDYSRIKENPSALRLSFSKTTGRFTGSYKVYLWTGTKLKYVSATVKGIVVGGVGYGTAKVSKYGTMPISVEPVEAE